MFDDDLLATEAAHLVGCSKARLRQIADAGEIACERHGKHGVRSFKRADLERLRASREAKQAARATCRHPRAADPDSASK